VSAVTTEAGLQGVTHGRSRKNLTTLVVAQREGGDGRAFAKHSLSFRLTCLALNRSTGGDAAKLHSWYCCGGGIICGQHVLGMIKAQFENCLFEYTRSDSAGFRAKAESVLIKLSLSASLSAVLAHHPAEGLGIGVMQTVYAHHDHYSRSRHDVVAIQPDPEDNTSIWYARLLMLFTVNNCPGVSEHTTQLAFVRYFEEESSSDIFDTWGRSAFAASPRALVLGASYGVIDFAKVIRKEHVVPNLGRGWVGRFGDDLTDDFEWTHRHWFINPWKWSLEPNHSASM
jgi:hypothetical protein